jgi:hypothetical protein
MQKIIFLVFSAPVEGKKYFFGLRGVAERKRILF